MKKLLLLAVSAALLAGCATSSATKVNKGIISGYSDKITNDARIVGDLKIEIVKTVTLETDRPCSTLDFVKTIISQDRSIHDVLNIRSEEAYKNEVSEDGTKQHRSVLGCDYIGLAVRYIPVDSPASASSAPTQSSSRSIE